VVAVTIGNLSMPFFGSFAQVHPSEIYGTIMADGVILTGDLSDGETRSNTPL
jgi:hypothetical protein